MAYPRSTEPRRADEPAFVFDPVRCTGCEACRVACGIENGGGQDTGWRQVHTLNPSRHPALPTRHLSLACNHCERPACMLGCPAAAYHRDDATGAVILDPAKCIGCRFCSWVCPYDAPRYDEAAGMMEKCTFCNHRLEWGLRPACVEACPTTALGLGTRADAGREPTGPSGSTGLGLLDWGLGPALVVRNGGLSTGEPGEEAVTGAPAGVGTAGLRQPVPPRKIGLRAEWTLLLFTLAIPALVAWIAAGLARPEHAASPWVFMGAGAAAMGLSTLHLGRPLRAWRAVLNLRTSPLSREVVLSSAFLGTGIVHLLLPEGSGLRLTVGALALAFGAGALLAVDGVYRAIPRAGRLRNAPRVRSADAWLTGALLVGFAAQVPVAWAPAALLKLLLGLRERSLPTPLVVLRFLLLATAALLAATGTSWVWPFLAALAGEILDRAGFYHQLEPASPGRTMAAQMTAAGRG